MATVNKKRKIFLVDRFIDDTVLQSVYVPVSCSKILGKTVHVRNFAEMLLY